MADGMGAIGGVIVLLLRRPVLAAFGAGPMFGIVGVAMLILVAHVAALGPRTAGRGVEEINPLPDLAR